MTTGILRAMSLAAWLPLGVSLAMISCSARDKGAVHITTNQEILTAIMNGEGKVTVVNFWATWCAPCVEEMPDLIRFYRKYEPRGIRFISVSIDDPDDPEKSLIPFMERQGVPFPVFLPGRSESPEGLTEPINPDWDAGLPATFVFDRDGNLHKSWLRDIEFAELVEVVGPLLTKAGS